MKLVTLLGVIIIRMKRLQNKTSCHEMRLVATNGYVFSVTHDVVAQFLQTKLYLSTLFLFCILMALVNPTVFGTSLPLAVRPVFWVINCSLVTVAWLLQLRAHAFLMCRFRRDFVFPSALFFVMPIALLIRVNYVVLENWYVFPPLEGAEIWGELLRYTLIAVVFELMLVFFVFPQVPEIRRIRWNGDEVAATTRDPGEIKQKGEGQTGDSTQAKELAASPNVEVRDRKIALDGLLYLKSVEHYVEFVFPEARELLRVALRDLTDQLDPKHGVQTHRSYWVPREAIEGMVRQNGNSFLKLKDGIEIPVSRTRRKVVNDWMQKFGPKLF